MWLSEQTNKNLNNKKTIIGEVSENTRNLISVNESIEHKNVRLISPYGIYYKVPIGEKCIISELENGYVSLGLVMETKNLSSGDLYLSVSNESGILIKANGDIQINGNVTINGKKI